MKSGFRFRILLLVVTLLFLMGSFPLSPRTRTIPLVVVGLTLLLLAAEIVLNRVGILRHPAQRSPTPSATTPRSLIEVPSPSVELLVFAWVLLCPFFIWSLGFSIGVPLFTFLFLRARSGYGFFESAILAAALWLVIQELLGGLLELFLYEGWLWGLTVDRGTWNVEH